MENDKIPVWLKEMRTEMMIVGLKSFGLTMLSGPVIIALTVALGIAGTGAPTALAIFTVLFIHFSFTMPSTRAIAEKYKKLVTEELEKRIREKANEDKKD